MAKQTGAAYVVTTTRHHKGRVYHSHLLRRSYREGTRVRNETLGNLSHLPDSLIDIIRRSLKGETFVPVAEAFTVTASRAQGHVQAVALMMKRLGLASLVASKPCRERDLVMAMVAACILAPHTKLATTRWWHTTTLAEGFGVTDADEQDCYAAMDWLLARQDRIQKKPATRHLTDRREPPKDSNPCRSRTPDRARSHRPEGGPDREPHQDGQTLHLGHSGHGVLFYA